jgi:hypothetical protein
LLHAQAETDLSRDGDVREWTRFDKYGKKRRGDLRFGGRCRDRHSQAGLSMVVGDMSCLLAVAVTRRQRSLQGRHNPRHQPPDHVFLQPWTWHSSLAGDDLVEGAKDGGSSTSDKSDNEDSRGGALSFCLGVAGAACSLPFFAETVSTSKFSVFPTASGDAERASCPSTTRRFVSGLESMFAGVG